MPGPVLTTQSAKPGALGPAAMAFKRTGATLATASSNPQTALFSISAAPYAAYAWPAVSRASLRRARHRPSRARHWPSRARHGLRRARVLLRRVDSQIGDRLCDVAG